MTLSCGCVLIEVNGIYFTEEYCDEHELQDDEELKVPIRKFKIKNLY